MLVTDRKWAEIRSQFSEAEKQRLRNASSGVTMCPAGISVDEKLLTPTLAAKLRAAVMGEV